MDVNLFGTFEVCRQVVPLMQRNGYGRVVNMASLAGKNGTPPPEGHFQTRSDAPCPRRTPQRTE